MKKKFVNEIATTMGASSSTIFSVLKDYVKGNPRIKPGGPIPVHLVDPVFLQERKEAKAVWLGHSTLLLKLDGKTLLLDPMFGKSPSPVGFFGGSRYSGTTPIEAEEIGDIDIVLISHDHYDHLECSTIKKIKDTVRYFCVPLGVDKHLKGWGVAPEKIMAFDWWEEAVIDGLTVVCTPARHFSGRGLMDRDRTLWCSWVAAGHQAKVYFSGDTGYGPHFTEIGKKYGPFDLTFMECGQFDERWAMIHMMPEETVQAHLDVQGKRMIPVHWGAFTLALHDWDAPVERAVKAAKAKGVSISTPEIGETVVIGSDRYPVSAWWRKEGI